MYKNSKTFVYSVLGKQIPSCKKYKLIYNINIRGGS